MIGRLACLALGGYAGLLGLVVHRQRVDIIGAVLPWGLLVALVLAWLVAVSAAQLTELGAAWAGGSWALAVLLLQLGEDVLVASDSLGWSFTIGPLLIFAVTAWWSAHRRSGSTS